VARFSLIHQRRYTRCKFQPNVMWSLMVSKEQDASFFKMFAVVLGALVVFTTVIVFVANKITGLMEASRGSDPQLRAIVAKRLAPIGSIAIAEAPTKKAAPAKAMSGADVIKATCFVCHGTGAAGAPRIGDKAAWKPRAAKGIDTLLQHAVSGFNAMPPKGGNAALSKAELKAAIEQMLADTDVSAGSAAASTPAVTAPAPAAVTGAPVTSMPAAPAAEAAAPKAASANSDARGEAVYKKVCFVCHDTGAAGAPKRGDKVAWAPRIAKGEATLRAHALKGFNAMPAKGGNPALSDDDIAHAIAYIISAATQ